MMVEGLGVPVRLVLDPAVVFVVLVQAVGAAAAGLSQHYNTRAYIQRLPVTGSHSTKR